MKELQRAKNFFIALAGLIIIDSTAYNINAYNNNKAKQVYATENIDDIIREQENMLNIEFTSIPQIDFTSYESPFEGTVIAATYENDTIFVDTENVWIPNIPYKVFWYDLHKGTEQPLRDVLSHEAGHHYTRQQAMILGADFLSTKTVEGFENGDENLKMKFFGQRLVAEGIAEYFELKTNDNKYLPTEFQAQTWKSMYKRYGIPVDYYSEGLLLVHPILEYHGVEKGVNMLITAPPPLEFDRVDLQAYSQSFLPY